MQLFFNMRAVDVCRWSYEEKNRIKASKIYKASINMEERYRKNNGISNDSKFINHGGFVEFPVSESFIKMRAKIGEKGVLKREG